MDNRESFQLTLGQQGIWFDQMLHKDKPIYNMGGYLLIEGSLNRELFEQAMKLLIARNDGLRIVLRNAGDVPVQEILSTLSHPIEYLDISDRKEPLEHARTWMQARIDKPFRLLDEPLFHFALIKLSESRYCWFHTYHHLIVDAYAHSLLVHQLAFVYTALARGNWEETARPPSVADHFRHDAAYRESQKFLDDANYWRERFPTLPEPIVERKQVGSETNSVRTELSLARGLYNRMEAFAGANGASTFHLILAALYIRFSRTANRDDFLVGLPTLNRSTASFKRTVGLFTGVTPGWFPLGTDITVGQLLAGIGRELRQDYRHQRFPLHEINRCVGLHKQGRAQIFDIVLTYQKQSYDVTFDGMSVEQVSLRHGSEKTPLAIEVSEYNDELDVRVNINYSPNAFSEIEIELFKKQFTHVAETMLLDADVKVRDLDILPVEERELVLRGFQPDRKRYAPETTIGDAFSEQVRRTPLAIAVSFEGRAMTYGELDREADRIAGRLRLRGVRPGSFVGICLEPSADLVVALLGVLKAGAAYVPIDPAWPLHRQHVVCVDSGVRLVMVDCAERVFPQNVEMLMKQEGDQAGPHRAAEISNALPNDPAYVIYTSGSTGEPKGTIVSHHNVIRLMKATHRTFQFGTDDVWTLFHSFAFDFSVWEIFGCLLHGGRLVIVSHWVARSPDEFLLLLREEGVTVLNQTPSALKQLMRAEEFQRDKLPLVLKWIVLGGEALDPTCLEGWFTRYGDDRPAIINMYGITETTVHVTHRRITGADVLAGRSLIGGAMEDMTIYVLDAEGRPVPVGTTGEMYIGGGGVALGYLNRPKLTESRFLPDCFSGDPGALMYRSGDIGRFLPNGDLEYLGRVDEQVKVRGFRVELGEIRVRLLAYESVADCVVLARTGPNGSGVQICAYVVARNGEFATNDCREYLRKSLPDYMIPSHFVRIPVVPLTANGKTDKQALPIPDMLVERPIATPPSSRLEAALAEIWKEELGLPSVSATENFFDLGGNSLLVVRVQRKIAERLERSISVADLFQSTSIRSLAALLACSAMEADGIARERGEARRMATMVRSSRRQSVASGGFE